MKIIVEKDLLTEELKLFVGIFEKKSLMEILQNIKITAFQHGNIELVATDLEIGLLTNFEAMVEGEGSFTVNGRDLYELISKMPSGNIEIEENNDAQIIIKSSTRKSKYVLMGMQSSDYPELPTSDFQNSIKLQMSVFSYMINKNYFIVSSEMKFNLSGALLSVYEEDIQMAATDGNRLSFTGNYEKKYSENPVDFIISKKALLELQKFGIEGEILLSYDENNIFFKYKNKILSSRVIDQNFPNYRAVIPEETLFSATVNKDELSDVLKRILIFKTRNNEIVFNFSENKLTLNKSSSEKGEGYEELNINYSGDEISATFNGIFIQEFLSHISSDEIEISMNNNESSFVFKPISGDNIEYLYVIMPLNI